MVAAEGTASAPFWGSIAESFQVGSAFGDFPDGALDGELPLVAVPSLLILDPTDGTSPKQTEIRFFPRASSEAELI